MSAGHGVGEGPAIGTFREMFERFGAECAQRIARGDPLPEADGLAFSVLLEVREASGRRLLGRYAGPDPSIDTVTGRCGHPPGGPRRW